MDNNIFLHQPPPILANSWMVDKAAAYAQTYARSYQDVSGTVLRGCCTRRFDHISANTVNLEADVFEYRKEDRR